MNKVTISNSGRKIEIELDEHYYQRLNDHIKQQRELYRKSTGEPLESFGYWFSARLEDAVNDGLNRLYADITREQDDH